MSHHCNLPADFERNALESRVAPSAKVNSDGLSCFMSEMYVIDGYAYATLAEAASHAGHSSLASPTT